MAGRSSYRRRSSWRGAVVATVFGIGVALLLLEGMVRLTMPDWRDFYSGRFMAPVENGTLNLGVPGFDGGFAQNNGDFHVRIRINQDGLRDALPAAAADGRIWVVGNSTAFGWGVEEADRYSDVLADLAGQPTYNIAAPSSHLLQYERLLRRMPESVRPKAVIVGLLLENNIYDYELIRADRDRAAAAPPQPPEVDMNWATSLIDFKKALTGSSALYNFLAVTLKRVPYFHDSMVALGVVNQEHAYQNQVAPAMFDRAIQSSANQLQAMKALYPEVPFVVLVGAARFEIRDNDPMYARMRQEIEAAMTARGIDYVDPYPAFIKAGFGPVHLAHDGHWSPLGHRIAAEALVPWVRRVMAGPAAAIPNGDTSVTNDTSPGKAAP